MIRIEKVYPTEFLFGNTELPVDKMQVKSKNGNVEPIEIQQKILNSINRVYTSIKSLQNQFSLTTDENQRKVFLEKEIRLTDRPKTIKKHLIHLKKFIITSMRNGEIILTPDEYIDSLENIQKLIELFYPENEVKVDDSEFYTEYITDLPLIDLKRPVGGRRKTRKLNNRKLKSRKTKRHRKKTNRRLQKNKRRTHKRR